MARADILHDHPRSKKARGDAQEAKKGDITTLPNGEEVESLGDEKDFDEGRRSGEITEPDSEILTGSSKEKPNEYQFWRRRKKKPGKPTS